MNIVAPATTVLQRPLKYIRGEKPSSGVYIKLSGNYRRDFGDAPDFCVCVPYFLYAPFYFFANVPLGAPHCFWHHKINT